MIREVSALTAKVKTWAVSRMFYTVFRKKTPTHIFFHISMNDAWIETKIAVNIPKEWQILTM